MIIRFSTYLYAAIEVTLRNSVDGWDADIYGTYSDGAWNFELDKGKYDSEFEFKFFIPEVHGALSGPNINMLAASSVTSFYDAITALYMFYADLEPVDYFHKG